MRHIRRSLTALVAGLLVAAASGCGYSLAGRGDFLPAHIRSIGVPMFKNSTSVVDVERRITQRVVSELIGRGKYRVITGTEATDAVLTGEILSISIVPAAANVDRQATRYTFVLTANVEFRDLKENKVIWSNPSLQFREPFEITGTTTDPSAFFGQDVNALDRLAGEFARTLVSSLLEAF